MNRVLDFSNTKPREPQRYSTPEVVERPANLVWAGSSSFGSHAMRGLLGCMRSAALQNVTARASASDGSGRVSMTPETAGIVFGPFGPQDATGAQGSSVYMIRGTLAHVVLAQALVRESLRRGEDPMVVGRLASSVNPNPEGWYTPEEAIEVAATLVGTPSFTFALPAARALRLRLEAWAKEIVAREQVVAIETQFEWHIAGAPWATTARYDLLTRNRASGLIYDYDYKTSADPASDKLKFAQNAQIMIQHTIGRVGYGSRFWGGVKLLLIEDKGAASLPEGAEPPRPVEWPVPVHPRMHDLATGIAAAQSRFAPFAASPNTAPANPLFCSGCPAAIRQVCFTT